MESQYNQLLSTSKTVSAFYENVYGPVLQTLPWIDNGDGLKTASEKVLGNIAYPAWELSTYKNQKEDPQTIAKLRTRCNELDAIYKQMQNELRPLLNTLPAQERTWEKLQEMVPKWKNLNSSDLLPYSMHKAVEEHFAPTSAMIMSASSRRRAGVQEVGPPVSTDEAVLGKIMAEKIRSLHDSGHSDHAIAMLFGSHGLWLDTGFLNRLR